VPAAASCSGKSKDFGRSVERHTSETAAGRSVSTRTGLKLPTHCGSPFGAPNLQTSNCFQRSGFIPRPRLEARSGTPTVAPVARSAEPCSYPALYSRQVGFDAVDALPALQEAQLTDATPSRLWAASPARIETAGITRYRRWLEQKRGLRFDGYEALWR